MLMPETAVHKDYSFIFGENYIRTSRQLLHILTITESFCKKILSYNFFRLRIRTADVRQLLLIAANPFFIFVDALFIAVLPVRLLAFFNGFFRLAGNLVPNLIGHILSGIADFVLRVLGGGK